MRQAASDRGSLTVGRFHRTRLISLEKKVMQTGFTEPGADAAASEASVARHHRMPGNMESNSRDTVVPGYVLTN
jgi:hypothetical protein